MLEKERVIDTDVLVIGTGLAGLRAAIEAKRYDVDVRLVDKTVPGWINNTAFSGGGIKHAGKDAPEKIIYEHFDQHFRDTVKWEGYLCDQEQAEILAIEAQPRTLELSEFGVQIPVMAGPREGRRHGQRITLPMLKYAQEMGVKTHGNVFISNLIKVGNEVVGAMGFEVYSGEFFVFKAKSTVLATGGAGEIYERNSTTANTTGEGYAMAYRVGAPLMNMEFVRFDPMLLAEPGLPWSGWITFCETRTKGVLRNKYGEPFFLKYVKEHKLNRENATWSLTDTFFKRYGIAANEVSGYLSRSMVTEVHEGRGDRGAVLYDFTHIPLKEWEVDPHTKINLSLFRGFPIDKKPVHVLPGAITTVGAVRINKDGESRIPGLYAAGEVAGCVFGANRLGGNALGNCLVFGARAGRSAALRARSMVMPKIDQAKIEEEKQALIALLERKPKKGGEPGELKRKIKLLMWRDVGVLKSGESLERAIREMKMIQDEDIPKLYANNPRQLRTAIEGMNMVDVGLMMAQASLLRTESRGATHYRLDYPEKDNKNWLKNILVGQINGKMKFWTEPVVITRLIPPEGD